jgi:hypothetical protein
MQADHITDAIKVAPPVTVAVTSLAGFHWDTVSYVLAAAYSALMICLTVWSRIIKPWLASRAARTG